MKWTSFEDIGIALVEKFPGVDPLTASLDEWREAGQRAGLDLPRSHAAGADD